MLEWKLLILKPESNIYNSQPSEEYEYMPHTHEHKTFCLPGVNICTEIPFP